MPTEGAEIVGDNSNSTANYKDNGLNNDKINNSKYELKYVETKDGTGYDLL